jgi:membrane-bound ClpP family serine protease
MNTVFAFAPLIDVPLTAIILAAFLWHLNQWAICKDAEGDMNLAPKLPTARFRIILFFTLTLMLCWSIDVAMWAVFAVLIGIGLIVSVAMDASVEGVLVGPLTALSILREWAFGFPQFILQPPAEQVADSSQYKRSEELVGKTGVTTTTLRPTGEALVDGDKFAVVAEGGGWIDAGTTVEILAYRNGMLWVVAVCQTEANAEEKTD